MEAQAAPKVDALYMKPNKTKYSLFQMQAERKFTCMRHAPLWSPKPKQPVQKSAGALDHGYMIAALSASFA
jgi:hypothetical protein